MRCPILSPGQLTPPDEEIKGIQQEGKKEHTSWTGALRQLCVLLPIPQKVPAAIRPLSLN